MRTGDWILCCTVLASLAGLALLGRWFRTHRGEEAGVPACTCEDRDDEMAVAEAAGVTVPPSDGSHDSLPEDKETDTAFWALAKTAGIEVER